jgi:hypothetical protein
MRYAICDCRKSHINHILIAYRKSHIAYHISQIAYRKSKEYYEDTSKKH